MKEEKWFLQKQQLEQQENTDLGNLRSHENVAKKESSLESEFPC